MKNMNLENRILPLLPLRDVVIFPNTIAPILINRHKSYITLLVSQDVDGGEYILLTTQKTQGITSPKSSDLHNVGILAKVIQTLILPNDSAKLVVEAVDRIKLDKIYDDEIFSAHYSILQDQLVTDLDILQDMSDTIISAFTQYARLNKKINPEIVESFNSKKEPSDKLNIIASHMICSIQDKQAILAESNLMNRAHMILDIIATENTNINTEISLKHRVKKQIEKNQRDFYLNEQMKAIQKELDGDNDTRSELSAFEKKIKDLKLSKDAKEKAISELKKLKTMNAATAESAVVRNYLDTLLSLPWGKQTKNKIDITHTENILNDNHHGLPKVKERIIEYLAVLKRSNKIKGPILCLIGPPGVGKTSLVQSIADAMGRKYVKFSLGGLRDEAEIRGHRKTYLGAMPGKIINLIKKSKVDNPIMLLDEIDKMSSDFRGDPASALLEVLDPEQNANFADHYLETEYDLSNILFIATANSYDLPKALIDRMEVIDVSGYIEDEKLEIAKHHLLPKQLKTHVVTKKELKISDDTILELIRYYTRESGVRGLERAIGALTRKALTKILKNPDIKSISIAPKDLEDYLGPKKYQFGLAEVKNQIGATTGLAYTSAGGDLLTIEAASYPGKGVIKSTGKLGDVMKESAEAAYSCFLSGAKALGLKENEYKNIDIHLHVPEGAVPKDGPSAGIAIYTTLVSLMTNTPVNKDIAMTGEITLRGKVLQIGGLKEKILAASRGGIKTVLIPSDNVKDLTEIPQSIKDKLDIIPVSNIKSVLEHALVSK